MREEKEKEKDDDTLWTQDGAKVELITLITK
jgi:hypothetical protein